MNRRNFFGRLVGAVATAWVAPAVTLPSRAEPEPFRYYRVRTRYLQSNGDRFANVARWYGDDESLDVTRAQVFDRDV